jgi:predicted Ser/Thr protein kinase
MADVAPLLPGDPQWLGGYRLIGRLGEGGQGTVYLAQPQSGQPVAVKLLRAEWTRDPVARARFAREVAAVGKVAPFCTARILDARVEGDQPFVVSEFIDGPSLQAVVARHGPLSGSALDRLAVATATALSAIHQAGVIHRDLKPGNVLLGPDGVRVIDFGIARSADASATLTSQLFGTPGYMAPEVVRGEPAGPAADVFAWAATITFAATGNPPFHGPNMAATIYQLTNGEPDLGVLSGHLRGIVAECVAKDPAARPTGVDLLMRLMQYSQQDEVTTQPPVFLQAPLQTAPMTDQYTQRPDPYAQRPGPFAEEPGPYAERPSQYAEEPGPYAEGPGQYPGGPGPYAEGPDPYAQGPGPYRQGPGQYAPWPGAYGQAPDPYAHVPATEAMPAPRNDRRGRAVAGWAAAIAGLVVLCVLGGLLVPRLIAGPSPDATPPAHPSGGPGTARHGRSPSVSAQTPADAIPARFAGTWSGEARQKKGVISQWSATLVLPEGATRGTFSIPTIPCSATVTVTQVTKVRILLSETVNSNPSGNCAASGVISISLAGAEAGTARMFWRDATDHGNIATGTLIRGG